MSTHVADLGGSNASRSHGGSLSQAKALSYTVPLGRALLAAPFVMAGPSHFAPAAVDYARAAGVPAAELLVPLSGLLAAAGGLSLLLGYRARVGAWLIVLFLVPVTFSMHAFWAVGDPMAAQVEIAMFTKNLAMLGGALIVAWFGAGPVSLDARRA